MKDPSAGNLLVASTLIDTPTVERSVCLLVHRQDDAVIGVMLNRPMQTPPGLLDGLFGSDEKSSQSRFRIPNPSAELPADSDESDDQSLIVPSAAALPSTETAPPIHFGGPLSGPLVAIHADADHAESETGKGIFVTAQKNNLQQLIRDADRPYRLMIGHLGWHPDQLQREIDEGWWHVLPASADSVFSDNAEMWPRLVRRATAGSMAKWMQIPDDERAHELN
ncbi:YqgE/AlgH family protein [Crateriforma spongiae]|uniref:YqgE/AlgH family protein n=1 Tax=Crateriforma spongiae TaxID=2724528 RepID=UPI0014455601|nr:YqgE/AlgH family protein [Crateriforma spongiae]